MKLHFQIKVIFTLSYIQKDITGEDYIHAQKVSKEFKIKNLGKYHDL